MIVFKLLKCQNMKNLSTERFEIKTKLLGKSLKINFTRSKFRCWQKIAIKDIYLNHNNQIIKKSAVFCGFCRFAFTATLSSSILSIHPNHRNLCSLKNSFIFFTSVISLIVSLLLSYLNVHHVLFVAFSFQDIVCNFSSSYFFEA